MYDSIFSPAFGNRPQTLVGREALMQSLENNLKCPPGSRERAMLLLGQRGSGKTVLLLELAERARKEGYIVASPTVTANGMLDRILEKIETDGQKTFAKARPHLSGGNVSAMGFGMGVQFQNPQPESRSFAYRLAAFCKTASAKNKRILILIDEVLANQEELKQLIIAYQEMVGAGYDIALVLAGLPGAVAATLNDHVLTFLNRSVKILLSPLSVADIDAYYSLAFQKIGIHISDEMRKTAASQTGGSPYLMQLIGHYITIYSSDKGEINETVFAQSIEMAKTDYFNDICQTSLAALSDKDIEFLCAMTPDEDISRISDISARMEVSAAYAQLYKKRLIEGGIIETAGRGKIQMAIPYLKEYLKQTLAE